MSPGPPSPTPGPTPTAPLITWASSLKPVSWNAIPGWSEDKLTEAWEPFLRSCTALKAQRAWTGVCIAAASVNASDSRAIREYFETAFTPYLVANPDGTQEGTITGYYEPVLKGSRKQSTAFHVPVYGVPDDLLAVDLGDIYPELKSLRLRGRLEGRRIVPYYPRADIESGKAKLTGREILWMEDPVELFFLQIQGYGKVVLDGAETVRISYADQNGYPYKSVGRLLVERGELTLDQASMQGIKAWAARNPDRLAELLNQNASYVFFREVPAISDGPPGALGVPLTAARSLAVDPRAVPLGAPVFLSTSMPNSPQPLNRLMAAQDTGGAIKGAVRGDVYWGSGPDAGVLAGRMRQSGKLWVLLPRGFPLGGY
jgi:membrane-bound lytic murein transglycosylase A